MPAAPDDAVEPSDRTLFAAYRNGSEDSAAALYGKYAPRLRALAAKYCTAAHAARFDAEDVVQSVFRILFQGVKREVYEVPPEGEIWNLLMVLALSKVRKLADHHQMQKRSIRRTVHLPEGTLDTDDQASQWLRLVVEEQLQGLPPSHRTILELRLAGFEVGEIAQRVNRSQRTVERTLHDFRTRLSES